MQPNVILIFTDQHRRDSLGCYHGIAESPHIDSLAVDFRRYVNALSGDEIIGVTHNAR